MKKIIMVCMIFSTITINSMDPEKLALQDIAFAFDLDGVFNTKPDHNALIKTFGNAKKVASFGWMLTFTDKCKMPFYVSRIPTLINKVKEFHSNTYGASNIAHEVINYVQETWGDDFSQYTDPVTKLMLDPVPTPEMTALLKKLQKNKYPILGASNQDDVQHNFYREKMKEHNVDIDALFHGMVTYRSYKHKDMKKESILIDTKHNWHSSKHPKPTAKFFDVVKAAAKERNPQCKSVVFVDDKDEFINGAKQNAKDTKDQSATLVPVKFTGAKNLSKWLITEKYLSE